MPSVTFVQEEFYPVTLGGGDAAPVAFKTVQLSGRQKKLRITGAASMLGYVQTGNNNHATSAPFNLSFGESGGLEKYFADTRGKDTFDITIPFSGRNQIAITVVWKGVYTWYPVENKFIFGLNRPMEISIHELEE